MGFKKKHEKYPEQDFYVGYYPASVPAQQPITLPVAQSVPIPMPQPIPVAAPMASTHLDQAILQQIEAAVAAACGTFRQPQVSHQVVHVNGGPGQVYNIRRRCPDTQPDTILKTIVVHQSPDLVNLTIEKPMAPPVVTREQIVYDQKPKALFKSNVVQVPYTPSYVCSTVPATVCTTYSSDYGCGMGMYGAGLGEFPSSAPLQGSSSLYDYGSTYSSNMNYPMNYGYSQTPYY
jgi:hypothetical protein